MKKVSLGVENFDLLIHECYFVDKSLFIKKFVNLPTTSVLLVTRPRRFGKSLCLSMIDSFFNIDNSFNENVFSKLKIWEYEEEVKDVFRSFPVIHLNFKDIYGESFSDIIRLLKYAITLEYEKFVKKSNGQFPLENYKKLINDNLDLTDFRHYLYLLINDVSAFYGQKVLLLIDEYDSPVQSAYENGYYDECVNFFKPFYSEALKGNEMLYKAFITGVIRITKESLFSGLNNIIVDCVTDQKYSNYFGFTYSEVEELLSYFSISSEYDKVIQYYGGYKFGDENIVNPWSVLSFIMNNCQYKCYWVNTSTNHILESFEKNNRINNINEIMQNGNNIISIDSVCSYKDIMSDHQSVLLYLLNLGYLTVGAYLTDDVAQLVFPNKEISKIFQNEIINRYSNSNGSNLIYKLRLAIMNEDVDTIEAIITEHLLSAFSYYEFDNEKNYQIFVLTLSALLFDNYIIKSECNEGLGRCDIIIKPKKENDIGIIIEVKALKQRTTAERLNMASLNAIRQSTKMNYTEELQKMHCKKIMIYGIAFYKKSVKINYTEQ